MVGLGLRVRVRVMLVRVRAVAEGVAMFYSILCILLLQEPTCDFVSILVMQFKLQEIN